MTGETRTVYIVPHTHWDREWYETFETFRGQLVELWDQLLALTDADPDFRFLMDGQSVVIDDYLEIRPQAQQRLENAVRRGQIQVGPWYTLPDEFLVSGETLVRDLQRGVADADAHGGSMRVGYLPDSFGHAAQMPQLYRQMGFAYAAVWRGVPLTLDRVAFIWKAPDGSEVLTAYMGNSYSHGVNLPTEVEALQQRIIGALNAIEPFRPTSDILLMNGNDHVLPQAALSTAVREAGRQANGTTMRLARLDDYLARLPARDWPTWSGELRSSARANVLMGTLSVRAGDKQLYARASRTLERLAEPLAALASIDATRALKEAWTLVLQNAAHDTACGSGIDAVAQAARQRSARAIAIAEGIATHALQQMAGDGKVWNPSPYPRQGIVALEGRPVLTAVIPGCAVADARPTTPSTPVRVTEDSLENGALRVTMHPDATISVLDKQTGAHYRHLHRLVDEADAGDEYNFSPLAGDGPGVLRASRIVSRIIEAEPARGAIEATFEVDMPGGLSSDRSRRSGAKVRIPFSLRVALEADSPRLEINLALDNRAADHRLRVHFPLPFVPAASAADTPFHVTRRPVVEAKRDPGAPEVELPTFPMRSFVDLSDGRVGLALITDGLHEYEVLPPPATELALTLLRAVGWLSRDDLTTRTGHAGPAMPTPGAQVPGRHEYRYWLHFHAGDWETGNVWRAAEAALLPFEVGQGPRRQPVARGIELDPPCVQMSACIPRADGFDLRILNAADHETEALALIQPLPGAVFVVDLLGEVQAPSAITAAGVRLSLRPWQIATLRIVR
jgi:mannosylglycerate hydrolase